MEPEATNAVAFSRPTNTRALETQKHMLDWVDIDVLGVEKSRLNGCLGESRAPVPPNESGSKVLGWELAPQPGLC